MYFNKNRLVNFLLKSSDIRLPINNSHYVTGKDLSLFSSLVCVENEISSLTRKFKQPLQ